MDYVQTFCILGACYQVANNFWGVAKNAKTGYSRLYITTETEAFILELNATNKLFETFKITVHHINRIQDKFQMKLCTMSFAKEFLKEIEKFLQQFIPGKGVFSKNFFSKRVFEIKDASKYLRKLLYYKNTMADIISQIEAELQVKNFELNMIQSIDTTQQDKYMRRFRKAAYCKSDGRVRQSGGNGNITSDSLQELLENPEKYKITDADYEKLSNGAPTYELDNPTTLYFEFDGGSEKYCTLMGYLTENAFTITDFRAEPEAMGLGSKCIEYFSKQLQNYNIALDVEDITDEAQGFWDKMYDRGFIPQ